MLRSIPRQHFLEGGVVELADVLEALRGDSDRRGSVAVWRKAHRGGEVQVFGPARPQAVLEAVAQQVGVNVFKEQPERVANDTRHHVELPAARFVGLVDALIGQVSYFVAGTVTEIIERGALHAPTDGLPLAVGKEVNRERVLRMVPA